MKWIYNTNGLVAPRLYLRTGLPEPPDRASTPVSLASKKLIHNTNGLMAPWLYLLIRISTNIHASVYLYSIQSTCTVHQSWDHAQLHVSMYQLSAAGKHPLPHPLPAYRLNVQFTYTCALMVWAKTRCTSVCLLAQRINYMTYFKILHIMICLLAWWDLVKYRLSYLFTLYIFLVHMYHIQELLHLWCVMLCLKLVLCRC